MTKLYYPIKPITVTQAFGENKTAYYKQAGMKGHGGIDFRATHGQSIYASHDGQCTPQIDAHGGNGVVLLSTDHTWETIYWHLIDDDAVVHTNQFVKAGDLLGYADNTGQSTGDHLHFGYRPYPIDWNNGYNGCVDPQPFFNGLYAQEINKPLPPKPKFQFTKTLKMGNWNSDVKALQTLLNAQIGSTLTLDGVFGVKTQHAVKSFQLAHHLVPDGVVGKNTNYQLNLL